MDQIIYGSAHFSRPEAQAFGRALGSIASGYEGKWPKRMVGHYIERCQDAAHDREDCRVISLRGPAPEPVAS